MDLPIQIVRYVIAFLVAYVVTYVLAAFLYTALVNAELASLDNVDVPLSAYLTGTWENMIGLGNSIFANATLNSGNYPAWIVSVLTGTYAGVLFVGLAIAFAVATLVKTDGSMQTSIIVAVVAGVLIAVAVHLLDNQGVMRTLVIGLIAIGAAFVLNIVANRVLPFLKPVAYPIAGAVTVGLVLFLIGWAQGAAAMAGAREAGGFILQMATGAVGGLVFAMLRPNAEA